MQSLLSPHGVYSAADVDAAMARVFGVGVRPLQLERALFEAMLAGWRSQQAARYLKPKTMHANERVVRAFVDQVGCWPWQWRAAPPLWLARSACSWRRSRATSPRSLRFRALSWAIWREASAASLGGENVEPVCSASTRK